MLVYGCSLLINILFHFVSGENSNVLGCGGFIKSHVPVDFSKIEVELYTKQGILKDKTNCAPNNGYYFIPLYDTGEYVLQLKPPPGWSFNPTVVNIVVDGSTDLCSQGKDINFVFKGFGIAGKVESYYKTGSGPIGINVELKSHNDLRKTITAKDGTFFFTPVYPGKYIVSVSHPKWRLYKSSVSVQVAEGNTELPTGSLLIEGYDVTGMIKSDGELTNIDIVLFHDARDNAPVHVRDCEQPLPEHLNSKGKALCYLHANTDGSFRFPTVSPGKYFVMPISKTQNIHFQTNKIQFEVKHGSTILPEVFEVVGFSISGKVLKSKDGEPLSGAKVTLNKQEIAITKSDGTYTLEKIKSNVYYINVFAENLEFEEREIKINSNFRVLPDLYPLKYKVCGNVLNDKAQTVVITRINTTDILITKSTPMKGEFCQFLFPGKYKVEVSINNVEKDQGFQFFPISHFLEVTTHPIYGITFSQLKATISGKIHCIRKSDCSTLKIVLRSVINDVTPYNKDLIADINGDSFTFTDIRPGKYELFLTPNKLCWKDNRHVMVVNSAVEVAPTFVQSGYSVTFVSSHFSQLMYKIEKEDNQRLITINKGKTPYCLEKPGMYAFVIESCHTYENDTIIYNTDSELNEIFLTAQKHTITLLIDARKKFGDLFVTVNLEGSKKLEGPLNYTDHYYVLTLLLGPTESAILIPHSDIMYFNPPILSIKGQDDCTNLGVQFNGVKGKVFQGKIIPPLSGVLITIETENSEALMDETDNQGKYRFPPLDEFKSYNILAKKDTYVIVGPDNAGNFIAHKLAEVIVEVVDQQNGSPLQGALLSLSGGESYRSNLQTNENGKITFHSLSPSEYFLKPMMKEYSFEPNSKIIDVKEGATVTIKLKGKRIAYSGFGQVTSLNEESEERISITAIGLNNCSQFSEESTSESNGNFRVRGLHPYCTYSMQVEGVIDDKRSIERAVPSAINFKIMENDVHNLKFTVFKSTYNTDILVRVYSLNPEIYKSLKLKLIREHPSSNVLHTIKLDSNAYKITKDNNAGIILQVPSVSMDNKSYSIQLETSIQNNRIKGHTYYFIANSSFKYIDIEYHTKVNISEQNIQQTSLWSLGLVFSSLVAIYNIEKCVEFIKKQFSQFNFESVTTYISNFSRKPTPTYIFDNNEIDQLVQSINATKRKPKPRKT